jgi:ubiquinone/menaquinone biosynthesis C-methylase UbiE
MSEWDAKAYYRQSALQQTLARQHLARVTLAGNEHVLDVGCGDGKITAEIAQRVPHGSVVGVDPSQDMIAFANRHFQSADYPNLRFQVADARRLPFHAEFDVVVSFNALHWVPEQEAALRSIRAALRFGRRAILEFVPEGKRKCLEDVIEDIRKEPRWAGYFQNFIKPYIHYEPEAYRALAEKCGFQVTETKVEDHAWDFKTREAFAAFGTATFVEWSRLIPEHERSAFVAEVLGRYQAIAAVDNPAEANTFKFYQMVVVLAVK